MGGDNLVGGLLLIAPRIAHGPRDGVGADAVNREVVGAVNRVEDFARGALVGCVVGGGVVWGWG